MKRFAGLDFIRGMAIVASVLILFLFSHFKGMSDWGGYAPQGFLLFLGYLTWGGGVFLLLSGTAHTVRTIDRVHTHPHQIVFRWSLLTVAVGLGFAALAWLLLGPPLLPGQAAQRTDSLLGGFFTGLPALGPDRLMAADTILMIFLNLFFLSLALRWTIRSRFEASFVRNYLIFLGLGSALLVSGFFSATLPASPFPLNLLTGSPTPLLPFLGFTFLGASLGLSLMTLRHMGWVWWLNGVFGAAALIAGAIVLTGLPVGPFQALHPHVSAILSLAVAGGVFLLTTLSLAYFDFGPSKRPSRRLRVTRTIRLFGQMSLTVWSFQLLLGQGFAAFLTVIVPGWNDSLPATALAALAFVFLWGAILKIWKTARFRGSLEWATQKILRAFGKPSTKLEV